jgi:hypothetical protein
MNLPLSPIKLCEDWDRDGMYLDKNPWLLEPSAMSLAWTPENMSTPATRVIGRAIAPPTSMFLPQIAKEHFAILMRTKRQKNLEV